MSELEAAEKKLERIKSDLNAAKSAYRQEIDNIPFGQPKIIGRPNIYKRADSLSHKMVVLYSELDKQTDRILMLKRKSLLKNLEGINDLKVVGKTDNASMGAATSVQNLEYFHKKLDDLMNYNIKAKANNRDKSKPHMQTVGSEISALTRKITYLEMMLDKAARAQPSKHAQSLIDSGKVNQWSKQPVFYFVKGLRKVALEIDDEGNFTMSLKYPAVSDKDRKVVEELLNEDQEEA